MAMKLLFSRINEERKCCFVLQVPSNEVTVEKQNDLTNSTSVENRILQGEKVLLELILILCDCHLVQLLCVVPHHAKNKFLSTYFTGSLVVI